MLTTPTAADLRAELARRRVKLYVIAPRVGMHPNNLSLVLQERRPLSPDLAGRLMRAILEETRSA
jgi:plasmid maintenance system antidote protein VapI